MVGVREHAPNYPGFENYQKYVSFEHYFKHFMWETGQNYDGQVEFKHKLLELVLWENEE